MTNAGDKITTTKYDGFDNYGKPKQDYLDRLAGIDDKELERECDKYIWLSAYASNNPHSDFHWMCDACYDETVKRGKVEIYKSAHSNLVRSLQ